MCDVVCDISDMGGVRCDRCCVCVLCIRVKVWCEVVVIEFIVNNI